MWLKTACVGQIRVPKNVFLVLFDIYLFNWYVCVGRYSIRNRELPTLEAPGAASIGFVGLGICCALIAAIMMLDIVGIHRHLVFLRKNVNYGWNRLVGVYHKKQPVEQTPDHSPSSTVCS